jgi:hypothetical protein
VSVGENGAKGFQTTGKLWPVGRGSRELVLKNMGALRFLQSGNL